MEFIIGQEEIPARLRGTHAEGKLPYASLRIARPPKVLPPGVLLV